LRILLDESLPLRLAAGLTGYEISTVHRERWLSLRNGVLLRAAADRGFDVFISMDGSLRYQQNLGAIGIAVIVIRGVRNRLRDLVPLIPRLKSALAVIKPGDVLEVSPPRTDVVRDAAAWTLPNGEFTSSPAASR